MKVINTRGQKVLIIPDCHIPYQHPDMHKFLAAIKEKYLDGYKYKVLHLGDELDKHGISFHKSNTDLFSAGHELEKSIDILHMKGGLYELFPKLFLLESNHGSLVYRRAKADGIPLHYIKSYVDILETPGWTWHPEIVLRTKLGDVYLCHGKTSAYGKLCKEQGMSAIQGHFHGKFEITWHGSVIKRFNLFSGCLIDEHSLAFEYGKNSTQRPLLGATLLNENGYPFLIPMNLNDKNKWDGKLQCLN